ncbi:MAG: tRNA (adenosine(37)-N6)-threonylcarbamoyltransferase complex dimerization subunit type 1 TsaB [Thermodesulfobacteriota bacterium]
MVFGHRQLVAVRRPLILALETAGVYGSVAVVDADRCLAEETWASGRTHSQGLLAAVDRLLRELDLGAADLAAVAVSQGPGSFTGLRIGLATAKGLAMAAGIPVLGVPTLDALAWQTTPTSLLVCPLLDARKGEVFTARYRWQPDSAQLRRVSDYQALPPEALAASLAEPVLLLGDGLVAYRQLLATALGDLATMVPLATVFPRASVVGWLGQRQLAAGETLDPAAGPLYVRPSEAEVNLGRSPAPGR